MCPWRTDVTASAGEAALQLGQWWSGLGHPGLAVVTTGGAPTVRALVVVVESTTHDLWCWCYCWCS